jgi:hypothetical protein
MRDTYALPPPLDYHTRTYPARDGTRRDAHRHDWLCAPQGAAAADRARGAAAADRVAPRGLRLRARGERCLRAARSAPGGGSCSACAAPARRPSSALARRARRRPCGAPTAAAAG